MEKAPTLSVHWPLFGLRVVTPRIEVRYVDDELGVALAELGARGIHDPATMPFMIPFTDTPSPAYERNSLQWYWRQRAETTPEHWHLDLAVLCDGEVVGSGSITADRFGTLRQVTTGSWLGLAHHGRGLGTELRHASLHLAFAGFGADRAISAAWWDNAASIGVSRKLGYEDNGVDVKPRRDQPDRMVNFVLTRGRWAERRRDDITLHGVDACADLLGLPG